MPPTPDLFTGWYDNQATRCREYWDNGVRGRYAHRYAICPHARHAVMRAPFGTYPDLPSNAQQELRAHG
ncbi:hypothetical protein [Luteibacter sp.]|jgi:hypothetical protein|uniref:hypothetical protein n=1 Tax=Luteibacter sp. TaxID=1886636 RepID=UPI002F4122DE